MMAQLVMRGPLASLWRTYEHSLKHHPVATNVVTSGVLWASGDLLAQRCASKSPAVDIRRAALTGLFGGCLIGPCGHVWYSHLLDRLAQFFGPEGSARALFAKVALDNTVWSIFYMSAFFAFGELVIDNGSWDTLSKQMREEFIPTYLAEVAAWPPIMAAIFTKLPANHHLLAVNLVTVLDVAFLAVIRSGSISLPQLDLKSLAAKLPTLPSIPASLLQAPVRQDASSTDEDAWDGELYGPQQNRMALPGLACLTTTGAAAAVAAAAAAGSSKQSGCKSKRSGRCTRPSHGHVGSSKSAVAADIPPGFGVSPGMIPFGPQFQQVLEQWVPPEYRIKFPQAMSAVTAAASASRSAGL